MRRYIVKRILLGILSIIGVSIVVFFAARLSGDVALLLAPMDATQAELDAVRAQLGLDQPMPAQYLVFAQGALKGDFGRSIRYRRPVVEMLLERVSPTLQLTVTAFVISIVLGILLGATCATRRGTWWDSFGKLFGLAGQSMPSFWVGISAILIFSVHLRWLPTGGRGGIENLVLPALVLAWLPVASIMRLTRSAMLDVLDSEYVKLARLKGNSERIVVWKHALRNALVPLAGLSGMQLANLIGGAVVIETVFSWPGMGSLIMDAVTSRDYPLIQGGVFLFSISCVLVNLLVDLSYAIIDPRIRYE